MDRPCVLADPDASGAESDEWLVFEVTDTGCGISQRGLASLFTEYVQVSPQAAASLAAGAHGDPNSGCGQIVIRPAWFPLSGPLVVIDLGPRGPLL